MALGRARRGRGRGRPGWEAVRACGGGGWSRSCSRGEDPCFAGAVELSIRTSGAAGTCEMRGCELLRTDADRARRDWCQCQRRVDHRVWVQ